MRSPFVVCGATGNVGSRVTEILLAAGEPVRAVGRERVRLGPLAAKGAEPWPGDIGDSAFLEKVFSGACGAFILIPPRYDAPDFREYQNRIGASLVSALSKARVPRIVALSSVGAHLSEGTGPILGLYDLETRLSTLKEAEVVCLRPAYFMENHLWSIPLIRSQGINGSPIRADVPLPMIATEDVADATARIFVEGKFHGHAVRVLLGPRDLTMTEATRILGEAIGKPGLQYFQFTEDDARKAMADAGMSGSVVEAMLEMQRGFNAGIVRPSRERSAESTTPTTLEGFSKSFFAHAYRAAA
ncbi:MAG TPA: NmrA family NAD(P)-binding protein, partial [Desulfobacteria bacterium]|nr:NmrA family NAD(P)-binding protein [Desulfobacteria bacterium]